MAEIADMPAGKRRGGIIPGSDEAAFTLYMPEALSLPILIAAPHGGRIYPQAVLDSMREPDWSRLRLEDRHADLLAREVARATGAALLVAHAPRALLDLNRAQDDVDWSMIAEGKTGRAAHSLANRRARSGLGLIPRRLPGLGEIWKTRIPRGELEARIEGIHRPYHRALGDALDRLRDRWGAALLIDLHSMPPLKPKTAQQQPAEFVVGDRFGASCDEMLAAATLGYFGEAGRRVAHNRPYSGGYVLDSHSAPRRGLHALQLEVCRSTYLDARMEEPGPRLPGVARLLSGLVRALAPEIAALGGGEALKAAAE